MEAGDGNARLDIRSEIAKLEKLHGNVAILARLDAILNDPNSALSDAERLINTDGALAATIIKLSNSVLYSIGDRRTDVYSALQKVGFNEALRLVGIALSRQIFMRDLVSYGISAHDYWRESFYAATLMEALARQALGVNRDRAYLVGLLHCIGKVVINEILLSKNVEILWDQYIPAEEWEEIMVGMNYAEAGAMLLRRWAFPDDIYLVVERQLDPAAVAGNPVQLLLAFVSSLMRQLSSDWRVPEDFNPQVPEQLAHLGLEPDRLIHACEAAREKVMQVSRTLRRMPFSAVA